MRASLSKWLLAGLISIPHLNLDACRYSVRDVGFVDLVATPYTWVVFPQEEPIPETQWSRLKGIANGAWLDANLVLKNIDSQTHRQTLLQNHPDTPTLASFLQSPDGNSLPLPPLPSPLDTASDETLLAYCRNLSESPARTLIKSQILDAYALVLLVEGPSPEDNRQAKSTLQSAISWITPLLNQFPKPVDVPPQLIQISANQLTQEKILLWSLGFNLEATEPQVAVLHGKGRRVGPILQGPLITLTRIQQHLQVIGQDCECELDRAWMQGPQIPMTWNQDDQKKAYQTLGFDPENPMVKTEISRILARGPNSSGRTASLQEPQLGVDLLGLGYQEIDLDPIPIQPTQPNPPTPSHPIQPLDPTDTTGKPSTPALTSTQPPNPLPLDPLKTIPAPSPTSSQPPKTSNTLPFTLTFAGLAFLITLIGAITLLFKRS